MTTDVTALGLKLVRSSDTVEIDLRPLQGLWTEEQYLRLSNQANLLIEFTDGRIEVLAMPTSRHQEILLWLYGRLKAVLGVTGGRVLVAPLRLRIRPGKFREPDILALLHGDDARYQDAFWLGADLVVEVVSPDQPERDLEEKPLDYAEARIPEYWIVNPTDETITVLTLHGLSYDARGPFRRGDRAASVLVRDFSVSVAEVFDAE